VRIKKVINFFRNEIFLPTPLFEQLPDFILFWPKKTPRFFALRNTSPCPETSQTPARSTWL